MTKLTSNFILLAKANQVGTHNSKEGRKYKPVMYPKLWKYMVHCINDNRDGTFSKHG